MKIETSTEKMAAALEATGLEREAAETAAAYQAACIVCGHGLLVLPWGEVVPAAKRVALDAEPGKRIQIHAFCLTEAGAGRRIAEELGLVEPEV